MTRIGLEMFKAPVKYWAKMDKGRKWHVINQTKTRACDGETTHMLCGEKSSSVEYASTGLVSGLPKDERRCQACTDRDYVAVAHWAIKSAAACLNDNGVVGWAMARTRHGSKEKAACINADMMRPSQIPEIEYPDAYAPTERAIALASLYDRRLPWSRGYDVNGVVHLRSAVGVFSFTDCPHGGPLVDTCGNKFKEMNVWQLVDAYQRLKGLIVTCMLCQMSRGET